MRYLLDTHTFLWFINDSQELKEDLKDLLESNIDLWLSTASLWKIAIKNSLGKLELPNSYAQQLLLLFPNSKKEVMIFSLKLP